MCFSNSPFASKQPVVAGCHKLHINAIFSQNKRVIHVGWQLIKDTFKLPLTCFLCHRLDPHEEPQQYPRKAHLDGDQLLSLSPSGFAPTPAKHPSSSDGRLRHPVNHHAGHGALLASRVLMEPPLVAQRYDKLKRSGADREMCCVGSEVTRREKIRLVCRWVCQVSQSVKKETSGLYFQNKTLAD